MKRVIALSMMILALILVMGFASDQPEEIARLKEENARLKAIAGPPPTSLDALLPPQSEQPVYLFKMLGMATPFTGIFVDLFKDDLQNAKANFESFKAQVDALGDALNKMPVDQEAVRKLSMGIGHESCFKCHMVHLPAAYANERWNELAKTEEQ